MAWLVRWPAEFTSRYALGEGVLTPFERIRKEKCMAPSAIFRTTTLYLQLKTARGPKGESAKHDGVWLGTIEMTDETLIGTSRGVVKCRGNIQPSEQGEEKAYSS